MNLSWMDRAACRDHPNPDIFFTDTRGKGAHRQIHEAQLVCEGCPVQESCLEHRQIVGASSGVWGGTSDGKAGRRKGIRHGTEAGAAQHRRRKEKPCRSCLDAENLERNERKARAKSYPPAREKLCPDCGLIKPGSEFYRRKEHLDGLNTYCKPCQNRRANLYKAGKKPAKPDSLQQQKRRYREAS